MSSTPSAGRGGKLTPDNIRVVGRHGSEDVSADLTKDGVTISMPTEEDYTYADLDFEATLAFGEWLITQAIAHGAGRKALTAVEETNDA